MPNFNTKQPQAKTNQLRNRHIKSTTTKLGHSHRQNPIRSASTKTTIEGDKRRTVRTQAGQQTVIRISKSRQTKQVKNRMK